MAIIEKKGKIKSADNSSLLKIKLKTAKEVIEFAENIINTVREPLIVLDKDLRVVKVSQSFYDFFKVTPDETIGALIYNLGNNQWDIPKLRELLETILPEKTTFDNFEVEHVFSAIGKRIMLLNARKIQTGSKKEQIILLAIEDITERKLADEALTISETRYRGLFESAKDGILILDSETGRIVDVNPILVDMLGYSKEQFINKSMWEIGVFKDIVANQENYLEFQQQGYNRYEHLPLETMDGRRIDIEFVSHVNIAHQQKVTQCNIRDITEHKQVEKLLRESEERYRILSELSPEMIYLVDLNGCITYLNKAGAEQFRVNPSEIVGKYITDVFPPDIAKENLTAIQKVIDTKTPSYTEREMIFPFGKMWVSARLSPVFDKEYQVVSVLGLSINISERKQFEESLTKQKEDFETIFNLVPAQIWYKDNHNNFIRVNRKACTDIGMTYDKIEGHSAEELFPSFAQQFFKDDLEVLNTRKPKLGITEQVNTASGEIRWVYTDKIPVFGNDGKTNGLIAVVQDITEHKRAEEALRNSEARLHTLVQTIPDLIWLKDANGVYLSCNKMFERFFGASETEIVGKTDYDFLDGELADFFCEYDRKAMAAGKPTSNEESVTFADDGHQAFLETIKTPMYDTNGMLIGVLGIGRDITARKHAEDLLLESEDKYRVLAESSPGMIFLIDVNGYIIYMNNAGAVPFNLNPKEIIGKHLMDIFPPDIAQQNLAEIQKIISNKKPLYSERKMLFPHGSIWLETRLTPILNKENQVVSVLGLSMNVTERKMVELELLKLSRVVEQGPAAVVITNRKGDIEYVNQKFCNISGYSKKELIGENPRILSSGHHDKKFYEELWNTLLSGDNWNGEILNKKKNGESYWESALISPLIDNKGEITHFVAIKEDITEKKKMIFELIKAKEMAESANKLKDAFIANMSHEIRTPLNGMLGMASLIRDILPGKIKKEDEELFEGMNYSSKRLIRTVDMILNYSRLQVGEFPVFRKNLELSTICINLVTEYAVAAKNKSLDLTFQNNYGDANLFADDYSIIMAISNLLDNAIKYTGKGFINVILYRGENDDIMLDIKDTGIGINEEYLEKVFEPYHQEQMGYGRAYEGIGLGLSLVKKVLALNNVKLFVESNKGEGTTFSLNFGNAVQSGDKMAETVMRVNIPPAPEEPVNGLVLLVEDDEINRMTIQKFIGSKYTIVITDSSEGALEILKKKKVNIILMDISIKGKKNGLELTKELKASKEFSHIPVIAVTAHAFEKDKQNALEAGCDSYLAKPFTKESLLEMIKKIIGLT